MVGIIKKQFSTFTVSYGDVEITPDNFWLYDVWIDSETGGTSIHGHELRYHTALQLRSDDEQQVREAMSEIVNHRRFWLSQLEDLLK